MRVCMIGTGYVGLVTGACLAEQGNHVWCVVIDEDKISRLNAGIVPIYEPGLEDIIKRNVSQGRLKFTTDTKEAVKNSFFVFIAVGTPPDGNGNADLKYVLQAAQNIGACMEGYKIIAIKSTVPVGTSYKIKTIITEELTKRGRTDIDFDVAFCPEFLKEGSAVDDFLSPDRIVIGTENDRTSAFLRELFSPYVQREPRILTVSISSAELIKYAANAMQPTRISFMNELANFCETVGADIEEVRRGIGTDKRIGPAFLYAGVGYGGSCFPKDVKALIRSAKEKGKDLSILQAVESVQAFSATLARRIEAEDTIVVNLRYRSGALGSINVTTLTYPKNLEGSITILGEKGTVKIGGIALNRIDTWEFDQPHPMDKEVEQANTNPTSVYGFGHLDFYSHVIEALKGNINGVVEGREGRKTVEIIQAAYQSALSGGQVKPCAMPR
ncbi:nucleotide sugar dehydrogenase [Acetomicrobium hydrogeniformans]|nr:nucleotide sugar dehydrogenase [Acetomicrobium hydrogeniformans]